MLKNLQQRENTGNETDSPKNWYKKLGKQNMETKSTVAITQNDSMTIREWDT